MKGLISLSVILSVSVAFEMTQFQVGVETSVHWNEKPEHILEREKAVPRSIAVQIKFQEEFTKAPQVGLANYGLDWIAGLEQGYLIRVQDVTEQGFTIKYTAVADKALYGVSVQWLAVYDPRVRVQWFETTDVKSLAKGEGDREETYVIPFDVQWPQKPVVAHFLMGAKFTAGNYIVFSNVAELTQKQFTFKVKTWYKTNLAVFRYCFFVGIGDSLWAADDFNFRIPDLNHFWRVFQQVSDRPVKGEITANPQFATGERANLYGFTGYDIEQTRNMRIYIRNFKAESKYSFEFGTWEDSIAYQMTIKFMVYKWNPNLRIVDPSCALLFSDCDFKGDGIQVCDRIDSLPTQGWQKRVKSLQVPSGRTLKLYTEEKLTGKVAVFKDSQECLADGIVYNFAQMQ